MQDVEVSVGDLVEVVWDDSAYWYKPDDVDELEDSCLTTTIGMIARVTEKSLFVAGEELSFDDGGYRVVTRIIRPQVVGVRRLVPEVSYENPLGLGNRPDDPSETC